MPKLVMLYLKRYVVYPVFDKDAEHLVQSKKKAASMCLKQLDACETLHHGLPNAGIWYLSSFEFSKARLSIIYQSTPR